MNQLVTRGIILSRTDYGEADRIITLLTPDYGKIRLMGRGVRRMKSKLAGGIELFSISDITFVKGRGEIGTLISSRLITHYGRIVQDVGRTMLGYDLIKQLNKATEDAPEPEYFTLLEQTFTALDNSSIDIDLIRFWFAAQILRLAGYTPNMYTDSSDKKLDVDQLYTFSYDSMTFEQQPDTGEFSADYIKLLRLAFSDNQPRVLAKVQGAPTLLPGLLSIVQRLLVDHVQR